MEYSYYGRLDPTPKAVREKNGVQHYMLDEHIRRTIEKEKIKFREEMSELIENTSKEIKTLKSSVFDIKKQLADFIKFNSPDGGDKRKKGKLKKNETFTDAEKAEMKTVIAKVKKTLAKKV